MPEESTPARQVVEAEIRAEGPITFARFMEIALYGEGGYYTSNVNAGADYATSPQMHPAFGALIAGWLFRAWEALGEPQCFDVMELGAGDGGLARDILDAVESGQGCGGQADQFGEALRYHAFDLRPRGDVRSVEDLLQPESVVGCVISNELLDAFPTHVFTVRGGSVLECYVGIDDRGELEFVNGEVSNMEISERVSEIVKRLPEGYRGEVNLGVANWASTVSRIVKRGYMLTIDYGHERGLLYHPARTEGSLRCYREHVLGQNPLRCIGQQDITAHVDFTAVSQALSEVGFYETAPLQTQRDFLFDLGIGEYIRALRRELASNTEERLANRLMTELRNLNALVDTRGLGDFKVAQFGFNSPEFDLKVLEFDPVFPFRKAQSHHLAFLPYD